MIPTIIILLLVLLNGLFVAAEFGIVAAPKTSFESMALSGNKFAISVNRILKDPLLQDRYIATAQVGITIASLGLGMYGEHVLADWIVEYIGHSTPLEIATTHTIASILSVAILTYFHIVIGEMIPKSLALQRSKYIMLGLAIPMRFFMSLFAPIVIALNSVNYFILEKLFKINRAESSVPAFSQEELQLIVQESESEGTIGNEIGEVIEHIFEFGDLVAGQVMVPRVQMHALPVRPQIDELREILKKTPHARYPVFSGDKDNVIGVVHIKDLALLHEASGETNLPMRPVPFVPKTAPLEAVVDAMRDLRTHMVVVLDEYGGTAGIITMQDIFEEIVGEIVEEEEVPSIETVNDGTLKVQGTVRLEEIADLLSVTIEEPEINSIGGLVLDRLGRPPKIGDEIQYKNLLVRVLKTRGRAARLCLVEKIETNQSD